MEKELQDSRIRDVEWGTQNSVLLKNIKGKVSVSLHIRRGDYLNIPNYDVFDGLKYYERAMAFVRKKHPQVVWVVFSNDAKWVRENLKMDGEAYYVDWNTGADSYKDMLLMSECSHHIIANSSFSWWGAWLNPNPGKMVLAPKLWFKNLEAENVVPSSWYLIDN